MSAAQAHIYSTGASKAFMAARPLVDNQNLDTTDAPPAPKSDPVATPTKVAALPIPPQSTAATGSEIRFYTEAYPEGVKLLGEETLRALAAGQRISRLNDAFLIAAHAHRLGRLQNELGPDDYQFLVSFLSDLKIAIEALDTVSIKDRNQFQELVENHDKFVEVMEEGIRKLEQKTASQRSKGEWARVQHGDALALKARIGMVRELCHRLETASQFWERLGARLQDAYPPQEVREVVQKYFSRFSQGIEKATEDEIETIRNVLERRKIGQRINERCKKLLDLDTAVGAHKKIPHEAILIDALQKQLSLDVSLEKLRALDLCYAQRAAAESESRLLGYVKTLGKEQLEEFSANLSAPDREILKSISKTTDRKTAIEGMIRRNAQYCEKMKEKIGKLEGQLAFNQDLDARAPLDDLQKLDASVDFLAFGKNGVIWQEFIQSLEKQVARSIDGPGAKERFKTFQNLKLWSSGLSTAASDDATATLLFFDDFYVLPIGNVIRQKEKLDGKWVVVDVTAVSASQKKETAASLTRTSIETAVQQHVKAPYTTVSFELKGDVLVPSESGRIKIFYESPEEVLKMNENRDFGQRTRLIRRRELGLSDSWPDNHAGDVARLLMKQGTNQDAWNPGRQRTAAVDRLQAVWVAKTVFSDILSGNSEKIDLKTLQHVSDYLAAIQGSDLAQMEGSFLSHPNFKSVFLFGAIQESVKFLILEKTVASSAALQEKERKYNLAVAARTLSEIVKSLSEWKLAIQEFQSALNEGQKAMFASYLGEFEKLGIAIDQLLDQFPEELFTISVMEDIGGVRKYSDDELEKLLHQTLLSGDWKKKLTGGLEALQIAGTKLATAEASPAIASRAAEMVRTVKMDPNIADKARSNVFQFPARVELIFNTLAAELSQFSPLHIGVRELWAEVKNRVQKIELFRGERRAEILKGSKNNAESFFRAEAARPLSSSVKAPQQRSSVAQAIELRTL